MRLRPVLTRRSWCRLAAVSATLLVLFTVAGFFAVPPLIKGQVTKRLGLLLHREVTVREVAFNPFTLTATVRGFEVAERGRPGRFLAFDEARINVEISSLFRGGLVVRELSIVRPYLSLRRNADLSYSISDLVEEWQKPAPAGADSRPARYSLNNIRIVDGSVDFRDEPRGLDHTARSINVSLPFLSNLPVYVETFVTPSFEARINDRVVALHGRSKPFSATRETAVDLSVKGIDVPFYLRYVPATFLPVTVASGTLDATAQVLFRQPPGAAPSMTVSGTLGLAGARVTERGGAPLFESDSVRAQIAAFDWAARTLHLAAVSVERPDVRVAIDRAGHLNLASLGGPATPPAAAPPAGRTTGFTVDVDRIEAGGGRVRFSDASVSPAFSADLGAISIVLTGLTTRTGGEAHATLDARSDAGESARLEGTVALAPWAVGGTLTLTGAPLARYAAYYRDKVLFDLGGTADATVRFRFADAGAGGARQASLDVAAHALSLRRRGDPAPLFEARSADMRRLDLDFVARTCAVGEVAASGGRLGLRWPKGGVLNATDLVPAASPRAAQDQPWSWTIDKINLGGFALAFDDFGPPDPVRFAATGLTVRGGSFSGAKGHRGTIAFEMRPEGGERIAGRGRIGVDPVAGELALELARVPVAPIAPYFAQSTSAIVAGGSLTAHLDYRWEPGEGGALRQAYKGNLTLADMDLIDPADSDELLQFGSLYLGGMDGTVNPTAFRAAEIALTDFHAHVVVDPDSTVNLKRAFGGPADASAAPDAPPVDPAAVALPAPAAPPAPPATANVVIDAATLQGGTIDFEDHFVRPNYAAHLTEVGGRLTGLSSIENRPADIDLRGKLDGYAPLTITGKLQPIGPTMFVEVSSRFTDMDLSPLTPYAGKYLGYRIEKGRLTWDVAYRVEKRQLRAEHKILLDQLTLGEKVPSDQATHLPVRLAISLLKDRDGRIELELPVTGSLDDPKFKVWPIVLAIVRNILVKVATSPFALFGHLFGGKGEELSVLAFDAGLDTIGPPGAVKIEALAKALHERPAMRLEVQGLYDRETDPEGLRTLLYLRKVRAQKLKDLVKAGAAAVPVDDVVVEPAEMEKYLQRAYKQEKFPKPRNAIGIAKSLPPAEMERLMRANIVVGDAELRQLATQRALHTKDALLASGAVEPERVLLVEAKEAPADGKVRGGRVQFSIK